MASLVTGTDVARAHAALTTDVRRTPTLHAPAVGRETGADVWLKAELFQRTGSFKIRGVLTVLRSLSRDELGRGTVTMSAGNHAAALAAGAAIVGTSATVVMPEHASPVKIAATRRYGGTVVLTARPLAEVMHEIAVHENRVVVHPFDDPRIIAGAAGVGLELVEDGPPYDVVVVPVGGGGLISGVAVAVKAAAPTTRVVGVEPVGADAMTRALAKGAPVTIAPQSVADGLTAPFAGAHTLAHVQALVDEVVTVDDDDIRAALRMLYERAKLAAEPAAAAAVAAVRTGRVTGGTVCCVVSGGNVDVDRLPELFGAS